MCICPSLNNYIYIYYVYIYIIPPPSLGVQYHTPVWNIPEQSTVSDSDSTLCGFGRLVSLCHGQDTLQIAIQVYRYMCIYSYIYIKFTANLNSLNLAFCCNQPIYVMMYIYRCIAIYKCIRVFTSLYIFIFYTYI